MKRLLLVLLGSFVLISCAKLSANKTDYEKPVEVSMLKFKFIPQVLEIKAGQTVQWVNKEKRQYHSVWFEKLGEAESEYLFPDDTWSKKFNKPGIYEYLCGPHPEMIGKIIVK